jgi:hypothetical protein
MQEVPAVNKLYRMIEQNAKTKGKIKLIGIGARDDIHYINFYRKKFKTPFPLFPDKELDIHRLIGGPETPFFIALKLKGGGKTNVFYTHLGKIPSAAEFLQLVVKKSGL